MSIYAYFTIKIDKLLTKYEVLELSSKILCIAETKNVFLSPYTYNSEDKNNVNELCFEINDSDCLFLGNNVQLFIDGLQVDTKEPLQSRMLTIQLLFKEVYKISNVDCIRFYIDSGFRQENYISYIYVDEFVATMIGLFKKERNLAPTIDFIIKKK
jgi:hypothetical protein